MCVFCSIINGDIPSYKIYEDDYTYAFLDIANDAIGHTLVIPKKHFENVLDIDNDYLNKVTSMVQLIAKHYVKDCGYTGVNIMNASGVDAQQSVFHLHFHIIPRKEKDGLNTWPEMQSETVDLQKVCDDLKIN